MQVIEYGIGNTDVGVDTTLIYALIRGCGEDKMR